MRLLNYLHIVVSFIWVCHSRFLEALPFLTSKDVTKSRSIMLKESSCSYTTMVRPLGEVAINSRCLTGIRRPSAKWMIKGLKGAELYNCFTCSIVIHIPTIPKNLIYEYGYDTSNSYKSKLEVRCFKYYCVGNHESQEKISILGARIASKQRFVHI